MAEYIERQKTLDVPTADVVERAEYEFLKKENKELAIKYDNAMNMVINGNEQLEKLRSKLDKALKEMDDLASHKVKPVSFDQAVAIDMCINILKRNIGE